MPNWEKTRPRKPPRERILNILTTVAIIGMALIAIWGMLNEVALITGFKVEW